MSKLKGERAGSDIQRELSVGYITSQNTLNWLIDLGVKLNG